MFSSLRVVQFLKNMGSNDALYNPSCMHCIFRLIRSIEAGSVSTLLYVPPCNVPVLNLPDDALLQRKL